MHLPKLTRRRLVAASAAAPRADRSAAFAQDATPPADGGLVDSATPSSVQQHVSDLSINQVATWPVAVATTFRVDRGAGSIASFDQNANRSCRSYGLVVVSGTRATMGNGTVRFSLKDYACLDDMLFWSFREPAVIQATPQTATPALVTARAEVGAANDDVVITLFSWDVHGQALPNVWVYWTCIVPGEQNPS